MASIVKSLRLLADPTRLRLLHLLQREELTVAEVQEILGMGQSRISSHLSPAQERPPRPGPPRGEEHLLRGARGFSAASRRSRRSWQRAAREIPETEGDLTGAAAGPAETPGQGAGIFQPAGGTLWPELLPRTHVERGLPPADDAGGANRRGRPRRRRGDALANAGAAREESHRHRQLGENGRIRVRAGAGARLHESRVPAGRHRGPSDRPRHRGPGALQPGAAPRKQSGAAPSRRPTGF